jgi:hypothetical protein
LSFENLFYERQIKLTTMVKLEDGRLFVKICFTLFLLKHGLEKLSKTTLGNHTRSGLFCIVAVPQLLKQCYHKIIRFAVLFWANLTHGFGTGLTLVKSSEPRVCPIRRGYPVIGKIIGI